MRELYVSDLDGTLLASNGRLTARTVAVLNNLLNRNEFSFTVATARSFSSMRHVTEALRLRLPAIVYGGAFLVHPENGAVYQANLMPQSAIETVMSVCDELGVQPIVYWLTDAGDRLSWTPDWQSEGVTEYVAQRKGDRRLHPVRSWDEIDTSKAFYVTTIGTSDEMSSLEAALADSRLDAHVVVQRDVYRRHETWLEVTSSQATKANATRQLLAQTGRARIIAFGDNVIDLSLFSIADRSYAVDNAIDVLKARATGVIASNDDDDVAEWLRDNVPPGDAEERASALSLVRSHTDWTEVGRLVGA